MRLYEFTITWSDGTTLVDRVWAEHVVEGAVRLMCRNVDSEHMGTDSGEPKTVDFREVKGE